MAKRAGGRGRAFPARQGFLVLMLTILLALPGVLRAESSGAPRADIVLVLDRSGSMQKSDPDGLAATGAKVFLGMLDPADRVAVVAFDTTARTLLPLSPVADGAPARGAIDGMGKPAGQWTDIKAALQSAAALLDGQAHADRQPAILFFTDGRPEVQNGGDGLPAGYREQLSATISRVGGRNIPVFTVGLGQGADFATIGQIARGTRAESFAATSASQVVRLFQDVLSRIKERHVAISFDEELAPGQAGQVHRFEVPPYTRLLTLSAVGGNVRIKGEAAGGLPLAQVPGLRAAEGGNYQVLTVPDPAPGSWVVQLEGAGRVEGYGQTESALRLNLTSPQPYSQVAVSRPVPVTVVVEGDPDPQSPLEVTAQSGSGEPVRLERRGDGFAGAVPLTDGRLVVWATRGGREVARRDFLLYPTGTPPVARGAGGEAGMAEPHRLRDVALVAAASLALAGALLAVGAWNWGRVRRREELLAGRLGGLSLARCGREVLIGAGPVLLRQPGAGRDLALGAGRDSALGAAGAEGRARVASISEGSTSGGWTASASATGPAPALATMSARLVPRRWAPLAGLGLVRRELRIYIHPAAGVRLQVNGRPPGDGRLYHGDAVRLNTETYTYANPALTRRPTRSRAPGGPTFTR